MGKGKERVRQDRIIGSEWVCMDSILIQNWKQKLIRNLSGMKNAHHSSHPKKKSQNSPYFNKRNPPSLRKILEEVKYLQSCVSQIDVPSKQDKTLQARQRQIRSVREQKTHSTQLCRKPRSIKQPKKITDFQHQFQSIQTIRKSSKKLLPQSTQLRNQSCTFEFSTLQRPNQSLKRPVQREDYFPMSFVSLQMENLLLEKQNLNLQKQLLEQELLMQRREKRLLKDKIKRIKTHNLAERLSSHSKGQKTKQNPSSDIKQYKHSPIKINIPQFLPQQAQVPISINTSKVYNKTKREPSNRANSHKQSKNDTIRTSKTFQSIISIKNVGQPQDSEELLISDVRKEQSKKENQGTLQHQFWTLLSQCQHEKSQKKWEIREALGDIANRLKVLRKN